MPKLSLTPSHIEFIKANRLLMSGSDMAKEFGVSKSVVNRYMKDNGLTAPIELFIRWRNEKRIGKTSYTSEQDQYIRDNYLTMPVKRIASDINGSSTGVYGRLKAMELTIPENVVEQRKKESQFKHGIIPANKGKKQPEYMTQESIERTKGTRFHKGNLPHNTYGQDNIIVDRKDKTGIKYQWIKLSHGKWRALHVHLWLQSFGKIPKDYIIIFKDGNTKNCSLDNLEAITRKENMLRNSIQRFPKELKEVIILNSKIKNKIYAKKKCVR